MARVDEHMKAHMLPQVIPRSTRALHYFAGTGRLDVQPKLTYHGHAMLAMGPPGLWQRMFLGLLCYYMSRERAAQSKSDRDAALFGIV